MPTPEAATLGTATPEAATPGTSEARRLAKDPTTAVIVLAGGASRRYGPDNKLLADVAGMPLVRRVVMRMLECRAGHVIVVTGHQSGLIEAAVADLRETGAVTVVHNTRHLEGMGFTVAAGIRALPGEVQRVVITPGDLPEISAALVHRLIAIADAVGGDRIVFPTLPTGQQRNPVLWPRPYFAELAALTGDTGARQLIKAHATAALPVPMTSAEAFVDIDRPEDLEAWRRGRTP